MSELDTSNRFLVGGLQTASGQRLRVMALFNQPLSHDDALNLAAWLVALTGEREKFLTLLDAIEAT